MRCNEMERPRDFGRTEENRGSVSMKASFRQHVLDVCAAKIARKGPGVGLSLYAFFQNRNDDPAQLLQMAEWWIMTHKLDHFEKAVKIQRLFEEMH
jgi:hypothetical protein